MAIQPLQIIAHIKSDFPSKFGVPRQSGLVEELQARVIFTPAFRDANLLRGIEGFSHLWLLWQFSQTMAEGWRPTVRPPRLGGNERRGVFATRSPFRPNAIGLSCVRLCTVQWQTPEGPQLLVAGVDLIDGTPIYDIKPYLPLSDCRPDASAGFSLQAAAHQLKVEIPEMELAKLPQKKQVALKKVLAQDPRPSYQTDPSRVYGFPFAGWEIRFCVAGDTLSVREILALEKEET